MSDSASPGAEEGSGTSTVTGGTSPLPSTDESGSSQPEEEVNNRSNTNDVQGPAVADTASYNETTDSTSRSEVPYAGEPHRATIPTEPVLPTGSTTEPSYFSPKPMRFQPANLPLPENAVSNITPRAKSAGYPQSHLDLPRPAYPLTPEHVSSHAQLERPGVQRDLSNTSTISNASTVRASNFNTFLQLSHQKTRDPSIFPNQAYSALQAQFHAPPNSSHFLRSRSSHPSTHTIYTAQSEASSPAQDDTISSTDPHSRTQSASSSPGLFTPTSSPLRSGVDQSDLEGTYSGPWLHRTHRQAPKETHIADVDVDPISGRKIINQYEFMDELGRGVHGKVKLGRDLNNGTYVAIKIVERYSKRKRLGKNNSHEAKIKKEIAILKKARHPNIVGLIEVIDDPRMKKVYIVLEYVEMGEVQWRTDGAKEINLLEYRRCQREAEGVYDNDTASLEDEHIYREAQRRLKRNEKRKWRQLQRQRSDQGVESWSLEYGNDDEEDDFSSPNVSRVPSSTTALSEVHQSEIASYDIATSEHPQGHESEEQYSQEHRTPGATSDNRHQYAPMDYPYNIGLEGTMYGAYESPLRGRTPSAAGSAGSAAWYVEYEEQVPEHFRYVPLLTLDEAREKFRDTVLGLEYLHYQGVIHRDIKPANLLQARDHHIKISDFGVSYLGKEKDDSFPVDEQSEAESHDNIYVSVELAKTVGTPAFYAPELCSTDCDPEAQPPPVTEQIDIWALGVTLYCLVFGRVPFYAHNTFVLMRNIAEEDVYIPNKRLKAVETSSGSRPASHGRIWQPAMNSNKRLAHELEYQEVDDELTDLLRRMLTKNPKERITLWEVKHHSWVVHGIVDKVRWLDETDPSRMTSGRKIEVSKEDVDVAVVPLTLMERTKSVARRGIERLGQTFGISKRQASESRRRAKSSATATSGDLSQPPSTASSSSTISLDARRQEYRRPSLRPDESIFSALKASREGDHPLSQSVTASPEVKDRPEFFPGLDGPDSRPESPISEISQSSRPRGLSSLQQRPSGPDRVHSTLSGGSIRTIRPGDLGLHAAGASTLPALPSTPLEMPTHPSLSGIFGGTKRKIVRRAGSRGSNSSAYGRASPVDRLLGGSDDPHGEPSLGLSNAIAAGRVNLPASLAEGSTTGGSAAASPISSRAPSISAAVSSAASPDHLRADFQSVEDGGLSRNSSLSSISSRRLYAPLARADFSHAPVQASYLPLLGEGSEESLTHPDPTSGPPAADDLFANARREQIRKLLLQQEQKDRPASSLGHSRAESSPSHPEACPRSPDDDAFYRRQKEEAEQAHNATMSPIDPLPEPSMLTGYPYQPLMSSSSEDQFTRMSQSTSNPSIPSVISADSSLPADDVYMAMRSHGSDAFWKQHDMPIIGGHQDDDFNYDGDGDHAVESDDDSDDSFIEMTRTKARKQGLTRSESISNAELSYHRARRETGGASSIRSVRSGSNNTMKKIKSRGGTDDEGQSRRLSALQ